MSSDRSRSSSDKADESKKTNRRNFLRYAAGGALALAAAAAGGYYFAKTPSGETTTTPTMTPTISQAARPVVIGGTLSYTGPLAQSAQILDRCINLGVLKSNLEGGILGHPVTLKIYDDGFDLQKVGPLYERLITEDKVDYVFGPFLTYLAGGMVNVTESHGMPLPVIFTASRTFFTQGYKYIIGPEMQKPYYGATGWQGFVDLFRKENVSKWLPPGQDPPKTAALMEINTAYGIEQRDTLAPELRDECGLDVVMVELFDQATTDFTPILNKIKALNPDILHRGDYLNHEVALIQQMHEQKIKPKFTTGEGGLYKEVWLRPDLGGVDPKWAEGDCSIDYGVDTRHAGWADFIRSEYPKRYGTPPGSAALHALQLIEIIHNAANASGRLGDYDGFMRVLREQVFPLTLYDLQLADDGTDLNATKHLGQLQIQNGQYVRIWKPEDASGTLVYPKP